MRAGCRRNRPLDRSEPPTCGCAFTKAYAQSRRLPYVTRRLPHAAADGARNWTITDSISAEHLPATPQPRPIRRALHAAIGRMKTYGLGRAQSAAAPASQRAKFDGRIVLFRRGAVLLHFGGRRNASFDHFLLWRCSAVLRRVRHLDSIGNNSRNSRFGCIYSRLGRANSRLAWLRELHCNALISPVIFSPEWRFRGRSPRIPGSTGITGKPRRSLFAARGAMRSGSAVGCRGRAAPGRGSCMAHPRRDRPRLW